MLPYSGQWHRAKEKEHEEVILFVHHYQGNQTHLKRHIEFVNRIGFDAVSFDLSFNKGPYPKRIPWDTEQRFGYLNVWNEEISHMINTLARPVHLYAFSSIATAAFLSIGGRKGQDISSIVCDSGPFADSLRCFWNLYTHGFKAESLLKKAALTLSTVALYGLNRKEGIHKAMKRVPENLPILSIRGWKDPLVPYDAIESFFEPYEHLNLQTFSLPEAKHLDGLKNFRAEYETSVSDFLKSHSKPA